MWRSQTRQGAHLSLCGCMCVCGEWGQWGKALGVLERMEAAGVEPNIVVISAAVAACNKVCHVDLGRRRRPRQGPLIWVQVALVTGSVPSPPYTCICIYVSPVYMYMYICKPCRTTHAPSSYARTHMRVHTHTSETDRLTD